METTRTRNFGAGLFILLGFAALFFLATKTTNLDSVTARQGYQVSARFEDVSGLKARSPVTMSGVNIGHVESIQFDKDRLNAMVMMRISSDFDTIPDDSDASILTSGLLGSKYIGIGAGGSETFLEDDSEIEFTQSAVVLENLIGKLMYRLGGE